MIKNRKIFEAKKIYKNIGKHSIIKNANFIVFENRIHVFIGENGAGKSTLMNICSGNDLNFEGDLLFNDKDFDSINVPKSFLFFNTNLKFPHYLNAFEYVKEYIYLFNDKKVNKNLILDKFKEYGLENKINNNPNSFSSGEQKKLILLFSELACPTLLFLDEPDSNLDPTARKMLYKKLNNFGELGITVFISTHLIDEVKKYTKDATFIKRGEIVWTGEISNSQDLITLYNKHIIG
ncbi:ATP-binding cassette domain-containing protein [Mycoplasma enhydrae]|uniref:ATP-binding cassette domain-containing protein n=1 Tax=Mycoplasma enhydrae TaxID=2499220 RepID=UPI00197B4D1C|nr:ATP-binding cassette domain-containing protein [Mycoplasma enhydrae]MBN4089691.1 ABC transporter ATP-binding protein [Mycoplasma enhydrae]MCV3753412.1 ATP-binding cassette domain-containing protein [Mycoplasma enhydrae]